MILIQFIGYKCTLIFKLSWVIVVKSVIISFLPVVGVVHVCLGVILDLLKHVQI